MSQSTRTRAMCDWDLLYLLLAAVVTVTAASRPADHYHTASSDSDDLSSSSEGSGPDDEDFSHLFADVSDVTVRCYKCIGSDELSGCNMTLLRQNPEDYVIDCNGHCLNLSTENTTLFECTRDLAVKQSHCFQKDTITMCVCGTDLCNASPRTRNFVELPTSRQGILLSSHSYDDVILPKTSERRESSRTQAMNVEARSGAASVEVCRDFLLVVVSLWWLVGAVGAARLIVAVK